MIDHAQGLQESWTKREGEWKLVLRHKLQSLQQIPWGQEIEQEEEEEENNDDDDHNTLRSIDGTHTYMNMQMFIYVYVFVWS